MYRAAAKLLSTSRRSRAARLPLWLTQQWADDVPSQRLLIRHAREVSPLIVADGFRALETLPDDMRRADGIVSLMDRYRAAVRSLESTSDRDFREVARGLLRDGGSQAPSTPQWMSTAFQDWAHAGERSDAELDAVNQAVRQFFVHRVDARFLLGQTVQTPARRAARDVYLADEVRVAARDVEAVARRIYGAEFPRITVTDVPAMAGLGATVHPVAPASLRYVAVELMKNAVRATMDQHVLHGRNSLSAPSTVSVAIARDQEGGVLLQVDDAGTGLPESAHPWRFFSSTAAPPAAEAAGSISSSSMRSLSMHSVSTSMQSQPHVHANSPRNLAGFGIGLKLAQIHCTHFGGELTLAPNPEAERGCRATARLGNALVEPRSEYAVEAVDEARAMYA